MALMIPAAARLPAAIMALLLPPHPGGDGYLWLETGNLANEDLWLNDPQLAVDSELRLRLLKGMYSLDPWAEPAQYDAFMARLRAMPPTTGSGGNCNLETDDDGGTYLWAEESDGNKSTPRVCAGSEVNQTVNPWSPYAYDAAYAIAHAVHELVEVQNKTQIVGAELMESLLRHVSFKGITGLVSFSGGSEEPNQQGRGDRRTDIRFNVVNYVDNALGLVTVGTWVPCKDRGVLVGCSFSERWQASGQPLIFSTADNSRPEAFGCSENMVPVPLALFTSCVCLEGYEQANTSEPCLPCEPDTRCAVQAPWAKLDCPSENENTFDGCAPCVRRRDPNLLPKTGWI